MPGEEVLARENNLHNRDAIILVRIAMASRIPVSLFNKRLEVVLSCHEKGCRYVAKTKTEALRLQAARD